MRRQPRGVWILCPLFLSLALHAQAQDAAAPADEAAPAAAAEAPAENKDKQAKDKAAAEEEDTSAPAAAPTAAPETLPAPAQAGPAWTGPASPAPDPAAPAPTVAPPATPPASSSTPAPADVDDGPAAVETTPTPTAAVPGGASPSQGFSAAAWVDEPPPPTYPWVENNGYLRLRGDYFNNISLLTYVGGTSRAFTSGQPPPLTEMQSNADNFARNETTVTSANMRMRYSPTIHLAENLRIKTTIDMLDNLVLGSTPDGLYQRNDMPMVAFSGGQMPPEAGRNAAQDSVRVKRLWGEWKTPFGMLLFGRVPSQWGMGLLANAGNCEDCDYGDSVDRVMLLTRLYGTYIALAWDFVATGATSALAADPAGQPRNLDDADDVDEYVVALFRKPMSDSDKKQRERDLNELRKPVIDYGIYYVHREQELTSEWLGGDAAEPKYERIPDAVNDPYNQPGVLSAEDLYGLTRRDAKVHIPDVWARFEWRPKRGHQLRVEAEAVALIGSIGDAGLTPNLDDPSPRDIFMWGGAVQADYRIGGLRLGLELGAASGGELFAFGIHDGPAVPEGTEADITNFRFDRDYHVDMIMFREVIGAVTNAVYVKPTIEYDFLRTGASTVGIRFDAIYARALVAEQVTSSQVKGTPSGKPNYGVELDGTLFFREPKRFSLQAAYGMFIPMDAFNLPEALLPEGVSPEAQVAHTVQARLVMKF